ncbi:MAG TPA: TIGR01459 family HAD-type hydrolase [Sphingomicrobium sp.]|nr:TIGR01459 family HAD-type hydrolase [Sphingomicrobium sp.]
MSFLDALDPRYRVILCDVWGVVHDGVRLYSGAAQRLQDWRSDGRCVCLITNAPRTALAVERQLARIGLPRDAYDFVSTSGEAGIAALNRLARPIGFVGTAEDRVILEGRGVRITDDEDFSELACTGVMEGRPQPTDYRLDLERWAQRDVVMHCLNPDRMVVRGGEIEACAGAITDLYLELGGRVTWYGKPHKAIYSHALGRAGNPPKTNVLAVGDGLQTDMLGAAQIGIDAVFVTGGVHAGEPFPGDFAASHGLGDWRPVALVEDLA